jgi:hypothetical protein
MARPASWPATDGKRTRYIRVPVSDTEHAEITGRAQAVQRSTAEFIRLELLRPTATNGRKSGTARRAGA